MHWFVRSKIGNNKGFWFKLYTTALRVGEVTIMNIACLITARELKIKCVIYGTSLQDWPYYAADYKTCTAF